MKSPVRCLVIFIIVVMAAAHQSPISEDPEEGDKFEGDILLDPERNGLRDKSYRWPKRRVYYKFYADHHDDAERAMILTAMEHISNSTCITFHPATAGTRSYINITGYNDGCYAELGYRPTVRHLNLQKGGCFILGKVIHEFMHSLGFVHQQSAPDRNKYVKILMKNVKKGSKYNFMIFPSSVVKHFGVPYDYDSVMHYRATAFSKNGNPTIVPLNPNATIGQREDLSSKDIIKLNLMYKCPGYEATSFEEGFDNL